MAMGRAVTPNTWAAHSREASKDSGHHPSADGHWNSPSWHSGNTKARN